MGAGHHGVGAGRHGVERQARCRSADEAPTPGRPRAAGRRRGPGRRSCRARRRRRCCEGETMNTALASGVGFDEPRRPAAAGTFRGTPQTGSIYGLDVVRHGAREDQGGLHRLVGVARQDHAVAGSGQGEQQRVDAAGRAVDQKAAALAAPGRGGQRLRPVRTRAVDSRVSSTPPAMATSTASRASPKTSRMICRSALAELVAGRVEGHDTLRAIAQQGIDVGSRRLVGCLLRSFFTCRFRAALSLSPGSASVSAVVDSDVRCGRRLRRQRR